MRVFISWSGERSKLLATHLAEWLPMVLQSVKPWVSDKDIAAGGRWNQEVAGELQDCNFGIICLTPENRSAEWVLFEAGALSKSISDGRVIPLLFDLDFSEVTGPLGQFQAKKLDKEGLKAVVASIDSCAESKVEHGVRDRVIDALWPDLESKLQAVVKNVDGGKGTRGKPAVEEVLEELVTAIRSMEARERERGSDWEVRQRTLKRRLHPGMAMETALALSDGGRDPIALLVLGSFFKEEMPWLSEYLSDVYRSMASGTRVGTVEGARKLKRLVDRIERGGSLFEMSGGSKDVQMILRELPFLLDRAVGDEPEMAHAIQNRSSPGHETP